MLFVNITQGDALGEELLGFQPDLAAIIWTYDTPSLNKSLLFEGFEETLAHRLAILLCISDVGENLG